MSEYTARLDNWYVYLGYGDVRIFGDISEDKQERFFDGEPIITSPVKSIHIIQGGIVETKSGSLYFLGEPRVMKGENS